jgi:hypothetical protein
MEGCVGLTVNREEQNRRRVQAARGVVLRRTAAPAPQQKVVNRHLKAIRESIGAYMMRCTTDGPR